MVLFHHKAKQETKLIETSNPLFVASSSSLLAQYIMHVAAVFFSFPNDACWIDEGGGMWLYIAIQNIMQETRQCMHGLLN